MIIDYISNSVKYDCLSENIAKALMFLRTTDLHSLDKGRFEISGDEIFYIVDDYKTKPANDGMLEAHRKYIDIQTVISGSEYIGYELLSNQEALRECDKENDYVLYNGKPSFFKVEPDTFSIFFPNDLHMPGIDDENIAVRKLVIKVKI